MIKLHSINDASLQAKIAAYENALKKLQEPPYFISDIPAYTYYLSRLLNTITYQPNGGTNEIIERINYNSSFEDELINHGNNIEDLPAELNLKNILLDISNIIFYQNKKSETIFNFIYEEAYNELIIKKFLIICNNFDEDYLQSYIAGKGLQNVEIIRYKNFIKKKGEELEEYSIISYYLIGFRDFELYHNLSLDINLFLYSIEEQLFKYCINNYKSNLEHELKSEDRAFISGLHYEIPPPVPLSISQVIQKIIDRSNDWNEKEYDINIDDPDEESSESFYYKIEYENSTHVDNLKSSDTVFDENNNLVKVKNLQVGQKIRVYKLEFGEILLKTAMESQSEVFKEIDYHSKLWKQVLREIFIKNYNGDITSLHIDLKRHGVKVKESTVFNNWLFGETKFPQSDKSIQAIYKISKNIQLGLLYNSILKSKRIYNSTMISLGRDLKDEIKNFLINGTLGEILTNNNITSETLQITIENDMPLRKISNITFKLIKEGDLDE